MCYFGQVACGLDDFNLIPLSSDTQGYSKLEARSGVPFFGENIPGFPSIPSSAIPGLPFGQGLNSEDQGESGHSSGEGYGFPSFGGPQHSSIFPRSPESLKEQMEAIHGLTEHSTTDRPPSQAPGAKTSYLPLSIEKLLPASLQKLFKRSPAPEGKDNVSNPSVPDLTRQPDQSSPDQNSTSDQLPAGSNRRVKRGENEYYSGRTDEPPVQNSYTRQPSQSSSEGGGMFPDTHYQGRAFDSQSSQSGNYQKGSASDSLSRDASSGFLNDGHGHSQTFESDRTFSHGPGSGTYSYRYDNEHSPDYHSSSQHHEHQNRDFGSNFAGPRLHPSHDRNTIRGGQRPDGATPEFFGADSSSEQHTPHQNSRDESHDFTPSFFGRKGRGRGDHDQGGISPGKFDEPFARKKSV